ALTAVVAGGPAIERSRNHRAARGDAGDSELVAGLFHQQLVAPRCGGGLEKSIRVIAQALIRSVDADELVDPVVVGSDVVVRDRPVVAQAILGFSLEIVRAEAQRD